MTTLRLVWRELRERPGQLATSFIAISLGISVIVAIKTVAHFSEKAVARQLDELGANVLILPKGVSVGDYYTSDVHGEEMPEEYVGRILNSSLQGVDNLSPKLTQSMELGTGRILLTGILPKNEFGNKAAWAEAGGIFARPTGCGTVKSPLAFLQPGQPDKMAVRRAVVEELQPNEVLVGAEVAAAHNLKAGAKLTVKGKSFAVRQVLPETGTVDDSRVFAHLHTVQKLFAKPGKLNGIEILGCCQSIAAGTLIGGLNKLLPDARVVTIKQIASTQLKTNTLMEKFSVIFLAIIVIVGGAGIANYMQSNVQQRLREIGTLMALGMEPRSLLVVFLAKAVFLGVTGGLVGYVVGSLLAVVLGPQIAQAPVLPLPVWLGWAVLLSTGIAVVASALPAARAARLDPVIALREL